MLYDIIPPAVFILSLGGIVVILSRVVVRMQRAEVTASVQTAATTNRPARQVLKPAQKSVQAVTDRAGLMAVALRRSVTGVRSIGASAGTRISSWRAERQERRQAKAADNSKPDTASFRERVAVAATEVRAKVDRRRVAKSTDVEEPTSKGESDVEMASTHSPIVQEESEAEVKESPTITTRLVTSVAAVAKPATQAVVAPQRPAKKQERGLEQARKAIGQQDYHEAEDILVAYIVKHTKDTDAYMLLGEAALGREDWQEAVEIFDQVLTWSPEQPGAHAGLGSAAYRAGKYSQALQALQRAHEFEPTNVAILNDLLSIAQKMDNPALQTSITAKLSELAPEQQAGDQAN